MNVIKTKPILLQLVDNKLSNRAIKLADYNRTKYPSVLIQQHFDDEKRELQEAIADMDMENISLELYDVIHTGLMVVGYNPKDEHLRMQTFLQIDYLSHLASEAIGFGNTLKYYDITQVIADESQMLRWTMLQWVDQLFTIGYIKYALRFKFHSEYGNSLDSWPLVKKRYQQYVAPSRSEIAALKMSKTREIARSFYENVIIKVGSEGRQYVSV